MKDHTSGLDLDFGGDWQAGLEGLDVRSYRSGDEAAILATFNRVFRDACGADFVDRDVGSWRWAYCENPAGTRIILALAPDGTVAGQWAGLPNRVATPFGPRTFVQIVDSMVHPDYRKGTHDGPGLFALVGELGAVRWFGDEGDAVFYGYPVPRAERMGRRFLKYGIVRVVHYLCRPIDHPAEPRSPAIEVTRMARGDLENEAGGEAAVDALFAALAQRESCLLVRDAAYLRWRYFDCPQDPYEVYAARRGGRLVGLMVLRPHHELVPGACTIADWIVPEGGDREGDSEAADALLACAAKVGRAQGRQLLLAVFPPASVEDAALRRRGFAVVPSAGMLERRLTYRTSPRFPELTGEFLEHHWWYTLGDSDLV